MSSLPSEKKPEPKSLEVALLGGLLLASRLLKIPRPASAQPHPSSFPAMSDSTPTPAAAADAPAFADGPSFTDASQAGAAPASAPAAESSAASAPTEPNPLKRFQDLINSPETPDGHKVVAAVAAASTVTVAAVANWLMKATKK